MENANGGTITKFDGESNISSMNHFSISFPGDPGTAYWATYNFSGYPQFGPLWTFELSTDAGLDGINYSGGGFSANIDASLMTITYGDYGTPTANVLRYKNASSGAFQQFFFGWDFQEIDDGKIEEKCPTSEGSAPDGGNPCNDVVSFTDTTNIVTVLSLERAPVTCGDVRDSVVQEYTNSDYVSVDEVPICLDFTASASTLHYTFAQLSDPTLAGYALLRIPLMAPSYFGYGLDDWADLI